MDLSNILLSESVYFEQLNVETALAAASYPASGSFKDVRGAHRFGFIVPVGALNTALTLQVQQSVGVSGTPKDITGAVVTVAANDDNKNKIIEVGVDQLDSNNGYTHVSLKVTGPSGSDDYGAILFFKIGGGNVPVTQPSGTELVKLVG